ncbi:hypothetical protein L1987_84935 [Smallanthus sonchifolius]|uniref:Uncharacterized protein n=1 Tax=Smallanthus sonchifolius TaxID=185202 RepID=A0ACB8XVA8_9ASTR|nr:hypothetical protein L1987_84935 [Smallanthus sonchifolius]
MKDLLGTGIGPRGQIYITEINHLPSKCTQIWPFERVGTSVVVEDLDARWSNSLTIIFLRVTNRIPSLISPVVLTLPTQLHLIMKIPLTNPNP